MMKVCIVTTTRADYGLLYPLIKVLKNDSFFDLQIIASGTHLSPEFGLTYKQIEEDGFSINVKCEILLSSDSAVGITKSIGLGLISFAEAFQSLQPDIIILLGDRYEILAAAQAALVMKIPIAHLCGGDTTEGAFDDSIRHSITKMSHLHFVTNKVAFDFVLQLGENPKHVFNVGSTALDYLKSIELLNCTELEKRLEFKFREKNLLITFHPETLDDQSGNSADELLKALDQFDDKTGLLFTSPNADTEGRALKKKLADFCARKSNAKLFTSLGQLLYWSSLAQVDVIVGNSSSGLYEAPSFKKTTVNIGDRQKGRLQANSVINCAAKADEIYKAINQAFKLDCSATINPYGEGNAVPQIITQLKEIKNPKSLLKKTTFKLPLQEPSSNNIR